MNTLQIHVSTQKGKSLVFDVIASYEDIAVDGSSTYPERDACRMILQHVASDLDMPWQSFFKGTPSLSGGSSRKQALTNVSDTGEVSLNIGKDPKTVQFHDAYCREEDLNGRSRPSPFPAQHSWKAA